MGGGVDKYAYNNRVLSGGRGALGHLRHHNLSVTATPIAIPLVHIVYSSRKAVSQNMWVGTAIRTRWWITFKADY